MKKINLKEMLINNGYNVDRMEVLGMEFIRLNDGNYMIKDSNGRVVSEKEKIRLENKELVIKDITSNKCQEETTKKISKNKKKLKEIDKKLEEIDNVIEETSKSME